MGFIFTVVVFAAGYYVRGKFGTEINAWFHEKFK